MFGTRESGVAAFDVPKESLRPTLKIRCFGSFAVSGVRGWEQLGSIKKGRELIQYLAAHPRGIAARHTIAEALWPANDIDATAHRLHLAVSSARAALRPVLQGFDPIQYVGGGYAWHPDLVVNTDLAQFLEYAREGNIENARAGVALYEGEFLVTEQSEWIYPIRVRCASLYIGMLEMLAAHACDQHDYGAALCYGLDIVEYDRAHEGASRLVMHCLAALGRRQSALVEYRSLERFLASNLNVAPSEETTKLIASIMAS